MINGDTHKNHPKYLTCTSIKISSEVFLLDMNTENFFFVKRRDVAGHKIVCVPNNITYRHSHKDIVEALYDLNENKDIMFTTLKKCIITYSKLKSLYHLDIFMKLTSFAQNMDIVRYASVFKKITDFMSMRNLTRDSMSQNYINSMQPYVNYARNWILAGSWKASYEKTDFNLRSHLLISHSTPTQRYTFHYVLCKNEDMVISIHIPILEAKTESGDLSYNRLNLLFGLEAGTDFNLSNVLPFYIMDRPSSIHSNLDLVKVKCSLVGNRFISGGLSESSLDGVSIN